MLDISKFWFCLFFLILVMFDFKVIRLWKVIDNVWENGNWKLELG